MSPPQFFSEGTSHPSTTSTTRCRPRWHARHSRAEHCARASVSHPRLLPRGSWVRPLAAAYSAGSALPFKRGSSLVFERLHYNKGTGQALGQRIGATRAMHVCNGCWREVDDGDIYITRCGHQFCEASSDTARARPRARTIFPVRSANVTHTADEQPLPNNSFTRLPALQLNRVARVLPTRTTQTLKQVPTMRRRWSSRASAPFASPSCTAIRTSRCAKESRRNHDSCVFLSVNVNVALLSIAPNKCRRRP